MPKTIKAQIVKQGCIQDDPWQVLRYDEAGQLPQAEAGQNVIIPLASWQAERASWLAHDGQVAVWLAPDDDPAALQADLASLPLVAIDFPSFTDGRGYSQARLLRERYAYQGELRALGDVWQDVVRPLAQVGFDAFEIKPGKALEAALNGFEVFSTSYQATALQKQALFHRRVTL